MKREQQKPEVNFGPPVNMAAPTMDAAALRYEQQVRERQYKVPVGGGDSPPIPHLNYPMKEGLTMADQARAQHMPTPGVAVQHATQYPPAGAGAPPPIAPSDLLPESAKADPEFMRGPGEMYASSQPKMAMKYGIIRNGQHLMPVQTGSAGVAPGKIRPETAAQLAAVQNFQQTRQQAETRTMDSPEIAAAAGPAGDAAKFGQQSPGEKTLSSEEREQLKKVVNNLDDFDFQTFRDMQMKDVLNNEEQKKLIESRLEPMDLADLIVNGYVTQQVPINAKLTVEYQSSGGEEDLAIKRLVVQDARQQGILLDDQYVLDKYRLMIVALNVRSINKKPLLDHRDANGRFDDGKFWDKFNQVVRFNMHLLATLAINGFWFDIRVRRLFTAESLGNG
jgi:hypothetical protein